MRPRDPSSSSPSRALPTSRPCRAEQSRAAQPADAPREQLAFGLSVTGPENDSNTRERGNKAEDRATELLLRKGITIVERNFRTKLGELDIIARDGTTLVFVEVRSRQTNKFGSALDAVGWRKQRQVTKVAKLYLARRRPRFVSCRFDVIGITGNEIVHVQDAWRLTHGY